MKRDPAGWFTPSYDKSWGPALAGNPLEVDLLAVKQVVLQWDAMTAHTGSPTLAGAVLTATARASVLHIGRLTMPHLRHLKTGVPRQFVLQQGDRLEMSAPRECTVAIQFYRWPAG